MTKKKRTELTRVDFGNRRSAPPSAFLVDHRVGRHSPHRPDAALLRRRPRLYYTRDARGSLADEDRDHRARTAHAGSDADRARASRREAIVRAGDRSPARALEAGRHARDTR